MKRTPELRTLSEDHHHGLVHVRTKRGCYVRPEVRFTPYSRLPANSDHPARRNPAAIGALDTSVSAIKGLLPALSERRETVPAASRSSA